MLSAMSKLAVAMIKLAELQVGVAALTAEFAMSSLYDTTVAPPYGESDERISLATDGDPGCKDLQIEAVACVIKRRLTAGRDLGFQCSMRANFSDYIIREIAEEALRAAADVGVDPAPPI